MKCRSLSLIVIGLVSIILATSFILYEIGFRKSSVSSGPFSGALWQSPIEHFADSFAVDDEKVFTTDITGNIYCFNSQSGESVWNSTPRKYRSGDVVVSESRVYVGLGEGKVACLDESTGLLQWTLQRRYYQYPGDSPQIRVKDGRVYAIADGIGAYDAVTGVLLWQEASGKIANLNGTWSVSGRALNGDPVDANYVYAITGDFSSMHFVKLDTNNGNIIWFSDVTWNGTMLTWGVDYEVYAPRVLAISSGQVIMKTVFSSTSASYMLFALDSISGKELWSINLGSDIYGPIAYNNLLFFSKADGYVYAVNLAEGTIAWKTKVDTQNLFSIPNNYASPILHVDSQNQRLFWSYGGKQAESDNYTGTLCSLDLANGDVIWTKQIGTSPNGLVVNNDKIFLTDGGLWIFDASTGNLVQRQRFDHYVLSPIVLGGKAFVVADLWLAAYI